MFMAIKKSKDGAHWLNWEKKYRKPTKSQKTVIERDLHEEITYEKFLQWLFFRQWKALKAYANEQGILLIGDIPIFVAGDSADVWSQPKLFLLDKDGFPTVVAGVPPDYFSSTGQLWGNPLYDWKYHKKTEFAWWMKRIETQPHHERHCPHRPFPRTGELLGSSRRRRDRSRGTLGRGTGRCLF